MNKIKNQTYKGSLGMWCAPHRDTKSSVAPQVDSSKGPTHKICCIVAPGGGGGIGGNAPHRSNAISHTPRGVPPTVGRWWGETMCKCPRALSGGDWGDSWALKQWWGKAFAHSEDIKTISYSIIFYMMARVPTGATAMWSGGQTLRCLRAKRAHQERQPRAVST